MSFEKHIFFFQKSTKIHKYKALKTLIFVQRVQKKAFVRDCVIIQPKPYKWPEKPHFQPNLLK